MSILNSLTNKIAGEYPAYSINERAARVTALFTALNFFTGFVAAAYLQLGFYYTIFQLISSIPFFILFFLLVKRKYVQQAILLLVVILSLTFIFGWFYAGGINGPFIAGGIVIYYITLNIVLVKNRLHVSVYMIAVIAITFLMSYLHPHWVEEYPKDSGRYLDYLLMAVQLSGYFILIEASNRYCYTCEKNLVIERNHELEQANYAKLRLFAIISHDLKGPMATLKGILNSVDEGFSTPEKAQRQLIHLKTMTAPLNNTLNNLLLWSRHHLEGLNASPELFRVGEILQEEISLATEDAATHQVKIENRVAADTVVFADINQLRIIFRNLISNAISYSTSETTVMLASGEADGKTVFTVSNTGITIPLANAEEFNRTGKLDGNESAHKQRGLGLQLCYDFVKVNGGDIWIDTSVSSKTVFCFSSPKV